MAFRSLKSFFSTADELLRAELPELGEALLEHLNSYEDRVKQHGRLCQQYLCAMLENRNVGLGPLPPAPEYGASQPAVMRRLMEAWNWLERHGVLIPDPTCPGWYLISTKGEQLLARRLGDAASGSIQAKHSISSEPPSRRTDGAEEPFRFEIALSFPGGHRRRIEKIASALADVVGRQRVLYDRWHMAEFARPNLDVYLPKLYHEQSRLLVFFLCSDYALKEWCGLEWRAGRDLLKKNADDRLMFLRLDLADIPGLYSIDGYIDISHLSDDEVAREILNRLKVLVPGAVKTHPTVKMGSNASDIRVSDDSELVSCAVAPEQPKVHAQSPKSADFILEKRISATERLWSAVLQLKQDLSMPVLFFTVLLPSEYDSALSGERMHDVVSSITDTRIAAALNRASEVERDRPYLGEKLWSQFFGYRAFLGRLAVLITMGEQHGHVENWRTDSGIRQILTAAFGQDVFQKSFGNDNDPHAIYRILDLLQSMMLKEIDCISSGS